MTKTDARTLIHVLTIQRIPFAWRREGSAHIVSFPGHLVPSIAMSVGAVGERKPRSKRGEHRRAV